MMIELPFRLASIANLRENWRMKAKRAKMHRDGAHLMLRAQVKEKPTLPVTIHITRIAPRPMDSDNLAISAKSLRDGIADWLGVDDGNPLVTWLYGQDKGKPNQYAARVTFE